jgi:6-pyruvoyltetrahydropterin/6-carboxytetrahydropterin synthase
VFELSVRARFSAAHHLVGYAGACAEPHGHNWDVEVFVRGRTLGETGMLLDFKRIKAAVSEAVQELDHRYLNDVESLKPLNPTSEHLARHLYNRLSATLHSGDCRVHRVTVHETPEVAATYAADEP